MDKMKQPGKSQGDGIKPTYEEDMKEEALREAQTRTSTKNNSPWKEERIIKN